MEPDFLNITDLARLTRISVRHARRLIRDGEIPAPMQLGRCQRWPRPVIEAWLQNATKPANSTQGGTK